MRKTFLNAVLFSAAFVTAAGTLVSCKDYDDDIQSLQDQINQKATASELTSQLSTLSGDLAATKSALNTQVEALKKEIAEAKADAGETAAALLKELEAKMATIDEAQKKIAALGDEIKKANEAQMAELTKKVQAMAGTVGDIVGQRLTSLVYAPDTYIDGVEAILFQTLQYKDWLKTGMMADSAVVKNKVYSIDNGEKEISYRVSPSVVKESSIESLEFLFNDAKHYVHETRAAQTSPLTVVGKTLKDGAMAVKVKKAWTESFGQNRDKFTIVSLKAKTVLSEAEKAAGTDPYVYSDWARLWEESVTPIIDNKTMIAHTGKGNWSYATNRNAEAAGKHFWNFTTVFPDKNGDAHPDGLTAKDPNTTDSKMYIAKTVAYNQPIDLRTLVQVCTWKQEVVDAEKGTVRQALTDEILKNPESYGLTFKFTLVDYWYKNLEETKDATNQIKFGKIAEDGFTLHSTAENGKLDNADAIGRTPVIQAALMDGDKVVDVVYFKIQWAATAPSTQVVAEGSLGNAAYLCAPADYTAWLGETYMNSLYADITEGGMSRDQFHAAYPAMMNKTTYETKDIKPAAGLGDLYVGKVDDKVKAAVAEGNMKGYQVIGSVKDLTDKAELTQTHNVEFTVAAEAVNPKAEADQTVNAFFVYLSSDKTNKVIVPVVLNIKAGKFVANYNYFGSQWSTGDKTVVGDADKFRNINPTLWSDSKLGNTTYKTTQMIGSLTYGYIKDGKAPTSIMNLLSYVNFEGKDKVDGSSDILFDEARLTLLPKNNVDTNKAAAWSVNKEAVTLDGVTYEPGKVLYETKTVAAVINGNNVYLVDKAEAQSAGEVSATGYPTSAARTLVGVKVPVKVTAEHCEGSVYDKYLTYFITPLEFIGTENAIELIDVKNGADSESVAIAKIIKLQEAFGQNHQQIFVFGEPKAKADNMVLINWYEVEDVIVDTDKALTSLNKNGGQDATCKTLLKEILNEAGDPSYTVKYDAVNDKLSFHNASGNAIAKDYKFNVEIPVTVNTKWQKNLKATLKVVIKSGL